MHARERVCVCAPIEVVMSASSLFTANRCACLCLLTLSLSLTHAHTFSLTLSLSLSQFFYLIYIIYYNIISYNTIQYKYNIILLLRHFRFLCFVLVVSPCLFNQSVQSGSLFLFTFWPHFLSLRFLPSSILFILYIIYI